MEREGHDNVNFFTGIEVEQTPAAGMKTLFVVGVHDTGVIAKHLNGLNHIYFGANHSFPKNTDTNDAATWSAWENMIRPFLELDIMCTLDVDINCVEGLLESGLCDDINFIPMISAKLPYIQQLGYNATIKLDDKDFRATTPGVWCHRIHTLMDPKAFTHWNEYTKDEPL